MNRDDRNRMARFENIMRRLDDAEKDTLFRLRAEGWAFTSVEGAKAQLGLIKTHARNHAVSVERMAELIQPGGKKQ